MNLLYTFIFGLPFLAFTFKRNLINYRLLQRKSILHSSGSASTGNPTTASHNNYVNSDSCITEKEVIHFFRDGHLFKENLLSRDKLIELNPLISDYVDSNMLITLKHKVEVTLGVEDTSALTIQDCKQMLSSIYPNFIPFLQLFNVWTLIPQCREIALNTQLGKVAAQLLGVSGVRLYQDSLFIKRPGDGPTNWHTDLNMSPFDTNDLLTVWIPLQPVPSIEQGGSCLMFASSSHRDFALPYWYSLDDKDIENRYDVTSHGPFAVGDCSFHHGWTLHSAPPNTSASTRIAYAVTYVRDGVSLLDGDCQTRFPDEEDNHSYKAWIEEVGWGGRAEHALLPLVYSDLSESTK